MGQVLIRNLDDEVIETYKLKARLKGTSVEQYLRDVIVQSAPLTQAERIALIDENMARFPEPIEPMTVEERREGLM